MSVLSQLCTEGTGDSGEAAVWSQNHPAEVSGQEMSTFQEPSPCFRVSAVHAGGHEPTPLLCSHTGKYYEIPHTLIHHPEHSPIICILCKE